jgi:hypothetical protein
VAGLHAWAGGGNMAMCAAHCAQRGHGLRVRRAGGLARAGLARRPAVRRGGGASVDAGPPFLRPVSALVPRFAALGLGFARSWLVARRASPRRSPAGPLPCGDDAGHDPKMSHGHGPRRGPAGPDSTITCHFVRCGFGRLRWHAPRDRTRIRIRRIARYASSQYEYRIYSAGIPHRLR